MQTPIGEWRCGSHGALFVVTSAAAAYRRARVAPNQRAPAPRAPARAVHVARKIGALDRAAARLTRDVRLYTPLRSAMMFVPSSRPV